MPDTSKLSRYLKPENCTDGDVIGFMDEGVIIDKTFKKDGRDEIKPVLEITVKFRGENKTYSPNQTTVKLLSAAWGTDTAKWVGKRASITILPANNGKDMIVAKPVKDKEGAGPKEAPADANGEDTIEEVPF